MINELQILNKRLIISLIIIYIIMFFFIRNILEYLINKENKYIVLFFEKEMIELIIDPLNHE